MEVAWSWGRLAEAIDVWVWRSSGGGSEVGD